MDWRVQGVETAVLAFLCETLASLKSWEEPVLEKLSVKREEKEYRMEVVGFQ